MSLPPLSLYVHLPWCVQKCPYCDFNSHKAGDNPPRGRYISALTRDLAAEAMRAAGRPLISIFLGGGTPSLFTPDEIAVILGQGPGEGLAGFTLSDDCEITMEANPGTIERGRLQDYRRAGVNRLSIGAQSFNAEILQVLGRIHGPQEIVDAYVEARNAGFDSINIDLMFALPGQTAALAMEDIDALVALSPPHVSYYQLTLEPNTVFHRRPPAGLPDDDLSWTIQTEGQRKLAESGYEQYEISAFAQDGHRCRHNLNYWGFGDYVAAGAGAHGKLTDAAGAVWRYAKPAHPQSFIEQAAKDSLADGLTRLDARDIGFEFMLNALRLNDGFSETDFEERTGQPFAALRASIERAVAEGIMQQADSGQWQPTETGFRYLNDLQARFLP